MANSKDFERIKDANGTIVEVSEELKNYALKDQDKIILGLGCFAMGEPVFGMHGTPTAKYYWFTAYKKKFYAVFATREVANKVFLEMRGKKVRRKSDRIRRV